MDCYTDRLHVCSAKIFNAMTHTGWLKGRFFLRFYQARQWGMTISKLGKVFYCNVLKDPSETPGDNHMNRNVGNSTLCMT